MVWYKETENWIWIWAAPLFSWVALGKFYLSEPLFSLLYLIL